MSLNDVISQLSQNNALMSRLVERLAPKRETSTIITLDGINTIGGSYQQYNTVPGFNQVTIGLLQGEVWVYLGSVKRPANGIWPAPFLKFDASSSIPTPIGKRNETVLTVVVAPGVPAKGTLIFYNY